MIDSKRIFNVLTKNFLGNGATVIFPLINIAFVLEKDGDSREAETRWACEDQPLYPGRHSGGRDVQQSEGDGRGEPFLLLLFLSHRTGKLLYSPQGSNCLNFLKKISKANNPIET